MGGGTLVYSIPNENENENKTNDGDPIAGFEDRIIGTDDSHVIGLFFFFFFLIPSSGKKCIISLKSHVKIIPT